MAVLKTEAGTWAVDWWYKDPVTGKQRRKQQTFQTKREADDFYETSIKAPKREGTYVAPSKMILRDVAENWLEMKKRTRKAQSYIRYAGQLKNYILPELGHRKMTELRYTDIETAGDKWAKESELSAKSVNALYSLVGAIFKYGRKKYGVKNNPILDVDRREDNESVDALDSADDDIIEIHDDGMDKDAHQRRVGPSEVYTPEQVKKLLDASKPGVEKIRHMLAILTGVRHGELNALRWENPAGQKIIDLDKRYIYVYRSLTQLKGKRILEKPKTKKSTRRIEIPLQLVSELRKWKLECPVSKHKWVFCDEAGQPFDRTVNNRALAAAAKRADIPRLSMHNLRHTFASQHLINGANPLEVSKLLGHSSADMTLRIYAHWIERDTSHSQEQLANVYGLAAGS
jgi:integrase